MLEPSIDSLMEKVHSKYMLVTLSAKRARALQVADSGESDDVESRKYVGTALKEIAAGELSWTFDNEEQSE
ncbi:MAG TPA: DNA-directed RNA polymerase subunit omega [Bacillales bacterium]|nr:DNA-directed RNA polymerase subunit omega [Bacillales bacterium]